MLGASLRSPDGTQGQPKGEDEVSTTQDTHVFGAIELHSLYATLKRVAEEIDTAPERFETTQAGLLAEMDADVILHAAKVIHRLSLWRKYPQVSPESYLP